MTSPAELGLVSYSAGEAAACRDERKTEVESSGPPVPPYEKSVTTPKPNTAPKENRHAVDMG